MSARRGENPRSKQRDISQEFKSFASLSKQLKSIIHDSNSTLTELRTSGSLVWDEESQKNFHLEDSELSFVSNVVASQPRIVIFGQSFAAKATLANHLLGEDVLGVPPLGTQDDKAYRLIRIKYGQRRCSSLSLQESFELIDHNSMNLQDRDWQTIPEWQVRIHSEGRSKDPASNAIADVTLNKTLLSYNVQIVISPHNLTGSNVQRTFEKCVGSGLPIIMYALDGDSLTRECQNSLLDLRAAAHEYPLLFVDCCLKYRPQIRLPPRKSLDYSSSDSQSPEDCEDDSAYDTDEVGAKAGTPNLNSGRGSNGGDAYRQSSLMSQLRNLGFLSDVNFESKSNQHLLSSRFENIHNGPGVVQSIHYILQWYLVQSASFLHRLHLKCMNMFIMSAFDMQRDILITPKRLEFAKKREAELFESLKGLAEERQVAISEMIRDTVESMENELVEEAVKCELRDIEESQEIEGISQSKAVKQCTQQIKDLVLTSLRAAVVERLVSTVDRLQDSYLGTLERCLQSLEAEGDKDSTSSTSHALQKILNSAYQIEVSVRSSSSVVKVFFERMKEILQSMKPFKAPPSLNEEWKRKVASTMIDNLDNQKLAKSLCSQFKSRLQNSHESFLSSLRQLEVKHSGRLEKTEEKRMKVRKHHAPVLARLALESTSFKDKVLHGMPKLEREIGRGQYGVVYSCKSWGGLMHCAVKSVVPPDDKHWNDLAMEFHYTRSIPAHKRIVAIAGSVVDQGYGGGGCSLAVLLIMERMQRDLHTGIKMGLDLPSRLQVALDVVEGIRYLHSLGLVHRDIKLKNVLLDAGDRGKITDLGFCKPEAMMSGSIVGTPIHMAPELFTGRYDHTVDTYAFGILFWYIIAGHVKLPQNFEKCHNKDHLWSSVKQGTRPERLRLFDDECWNLMASCWAGEMSQRPLLGVVHEQLQEIRCRALERIRPKGSMPDIQTDPQLISSNIL
ncbi:dual serine/threonine and tyrosine protein kinase-like [Apostichopus japonicus]|uniref:dual serine/threonine and tyrosine protein kinase-like n=1 Tax=Stichopus japonicus TaxID=307972 RepID=UPI003AB6B9ED